jgi:uncharacterized protein (TIGR03000 family)
MRKLSLVMMLALATLLVSVSDSSACCCFFSCCNSYCCRPCGYSYCYTAPCCIDYGCYFPAGTLHSPYGYGYVYGAGYAAATAPAAAKVIVSLPADAKLTANDKATVTASDRREFVTPALERGKSYSYTLKITVERDGKTIEEAKKIVVRAGELTKVNFELPVATASR